MPFLITENCSATDLNERFKNLQLITSGMGEVAWSGGCNVLFFFNIDLTLYKIHSKVPI